MGSTLTKFFSCPLPDARRRALVHLKNFLSSSSLHIFSLLKNVLFRQICPRSYRRALRIFCHASCFHEWKVNFLFLKNETIPGIIPLLNAQYGTCSLWSCPRGSTLMYSLCIKTGKHGKYTRHFNRLDEVSSFLDSEVWFVWEGNLSSPHFNSHRAWTVLDTKSELFEIEN